MKDKHSFRNNLLIVVLLVAVLWIVYGLEVIGLVDPMQYGIIPHYKEGLRGIIFSPFIHGSLEHLVSNTLPCAILLTVLLNAYPRVSLFVLGFIHIGSGSLVWLLAPNTGVHIGISGIIYGLAGFLIASGFFRKDRTALVIAIFTALMYGGMLGGFLPEKGISWQSHLYGALVGVVVAFAFRKIDLPPPTETEPEEVEPDRHFFDT